MEIDLSRVIAYSKDSLQSRALMRSIMLDLYPGKTREMNVLLDVYESGVPREIKNNGKIDDSLYCSYIQRIVNDYGLQEQYVIEGLNAWIDQCLSAGTAEKLNKPSVAVQENKVQPIVHKPIEKKTVEQVLGKASDFEIKVRNDNNIEIIKFRGFDEKEFIIPSHIDGKKVVGVAQNAYRGCKVVEKIVVSEGIEYIEMGAFADCIALKKVVLPSTLKKIGNQKANHILIANMYEKEEKGVFQNTLIETIDLPMSLECLGRETFKCCTKLSSINLPNRIHHLPNALFAGCKSLKSIQLPDDLYSIGESAFSGCELLEKIVLPNSLRNIKKYAFYSCNSLKTIELNEGLETIGDLAFGECKDLVEVVLPSTLVQIGTEVFNWHEYHAPYDRRRNGWFSDRNNPNLTIYCYSGTKGLEYARNEGIPIKDASKR